MARPIKETPILVGTDAERFISEMQRVENLSKEVRTSNREKLMKLYNAAKKRITKPNWNTFARTRTCTPSVS